MTSRKTKVKPFGVEIHSGSVGGILSRLYRRILFDLPVDEDRYNALMARYIQRCQNDAHRGERLAARMSLSQELMKESMTWKTWIKGLSFLRVNQFNFTAELHHEDGQVTKHTVTASTDKSDAEVGVILADLYRMILRDLNIDTVAYDGYMERYIVKTHLNLNRKDKASVRASVSKELLKEKENMTWKTWIKGLVFLNIDRLVIHATLHHDINRRITEHETSVKIGDLDPNIAED